MPGLAANFSRVTRTEEQLRRENVRNKDHANRIHKEVGAMSAISFTNSVARCQKSARGREHQESRIPLTARRMSNGLSPK